MGVFSKHHTLRSELWSTLTGLMWHKWDTAGGLLPGSILISRGDRQATAVDVFASKLVRGCLSVCKFKKPCQEKQGWVCQLLE